MPQVNVFQQYFAGECTYHDVARHAVDVCLIVTSEQGHVSYEVFISFFPHTSADDFAVSYDAQATKNIFSGQGRRSKRKEETYMQQLRSVADELATELGGTIFWDRPLIEARRG